MQLKLNFLLLACWWMAAFPAEGRILQKFGFEDYGKIRVSPDGTQCVVTDLRSATVLDSNNGQIQFACREPYIDAAGFSPDGNYLGVYSSSNGFFLFTRSGDLVTTKPAFPLGAINHIFMVSSDTVVVSQPLTGLYRISTGQSQWPLKTGLWTSVNPERTRFAIATTTSSQIYTLSAGILLYEYPVNEWTNWVHYGPGGIVALCGTSSTSFIHDDSGAVVQQTTATTMLVRFSHDAQHAYLAHDAGVLAFNLQNGQLTLAIASSGIRDFDLSPDGQKLFTLKSNGEVARWDLASHAQEQILYPGVSAGDSQAALAPDGRFVIADHGPNGTAYLWNTTGSTLAAQLPYHFQAPSVFGMAQDGAPLLLMTSGTQAFLINPFSAAPPQPLPCPVGEFTPDGQRVLVRNGAQQVDIYATLTGQKVATLLSPAHPVDALYASNNGQIIVGVGHHIRYGSSPYPHGPTLYFYSFKATSWNGATGESLGSLFNMPEIQIQSPDSIPSAQLRWDPLESTCRHASLSIL